MEAWDAEGDQGVELWHVARLSGNVNQHAAWTKTKILESQNFCYKNSLLRGTFVPLSGTVNQQKRPTIEAKETYSIVGLFCAA
jgi:hypothetical protein